MKVLEIRATTCGWEPVSTRWWIQRLPYKIECILENRVLSFESDPGTGVDFRSGGWFVDPIIPWADDRGQISVWVFHDFSCYGFLPWGEANHLMEQMSRITSIGRLRGKIAFWAVQPFKKRAWSSLQDWDGLEEKFRSNKGRIRFSTYQAPRLPMECKVSNN